MTGKFFHQTDLNLTESLARESVLLDSTESAPVLMIWRGPQAVVMGKNQNPWKECNLDWMRENGIPLARRVSGGGTVYHDPGNLNVSCVLDRKDYQTCEVLQAGVQALQSLGIDATIEGSGSIYASGRKVSGSAYCYRKNKVLHHFTLLVNADLEALTESLKPAGASLETHAVDSVRARVVNLTELRKEMQLEELGDAIRQSFSNRWQVELSEAPLPDVPARAVAEFGSTEWIWDQTPRFSFSLPEFGMAFTIRKGLIQDSNVEGIVGMPWRSSLTQELSTLADVSAARMESAIRTAGLSFPDS